MKNLIQLIKEYDLSKMLFPLLCAALAGCIYANLNFVEGQVLRSMCGPNAYLPGADSGIAFTAFGAAPENGSVTLPAWWVGLKSISYISILLLGAFMAPSRADSKHRVIDFILLLLVFTVSAMVIAALLGKPKPKVAKAHMQAVSLLLPILLFFGCTPAPQLGHDATQIIYIPSDPDSLEILTVVVDTIHQNDSIKVIGEPFVEEARKPIPEQDTFNCIVWALNEKIIDKPRFEEEVKRSFEVTNDKLPFGFRYKIIYVGSRININTLMDKFYEGTFNDWYGKYDKKGSINIVTGTTKAKGNSVLLGFTPVLTYGHDYYSHPAAGNTYNRIVMSFQGWGTGHTLVHEVGHWLGLSHTFELTSIEKEILGVHGELECRNIMNYQCYVDLFTGPQYDSTKEFGDNFRSYLYN